MGLFRVFSLLIWYVGKEKLGQCFQGKFQIEVQQAADFWAPGI